MKEKIKKNEEDKEEKILLIIGKFFRPIFIIGMGVFLYTLTPNILNTPLSNLTINQIIKLFFVIVSIFLCVIWLFRESDDETYKEFWGSLGLLAILGIILYLILHYL